MKKIVILYDSIIFSLQKAGGISSYWYNLCIRFLSSENLIFFIEKKFTGNIEHKKLLQKNRNFHNNIISVPLLYRFLNVKTYNLNEKFIFHSSYYRITKNELAVNVVTIHDFIHEKFYSGIRKWLHVLQKSYAIQNADVIITVSHNTRKDLLEFYPTINPDNVRVVYNGVSEEYFPIQNKLSFDNNSILFVGSREKYKNFNKLVEILNNIGKYNLIIVGSPLNKKEKVFLNTMLNNRWQIFTFLSNSELNYLYNSVNALAYVSSYEGFGIPLLESMNAGCPFIALRNSSICEVAGDAGVLIDSLTSNDFIKALDKITDKRADIIQKGFLRAKQFSWNKCFNETINIYQEFINK
jgi:glycosyltransferase involved in cell wall biosynthesis